MIGGLLQKLVKWFIKCRLFAHQTISERVAESIKQSKKCLSRSYDWYGRAQKLVSAWLEWVVGQKLVLE
jgi:hypothetical protein